ncbi:MAG: hypothetical protein RL150_406 [Candidatus Parcubacteria bacterium]|jgi:ATP-dependent Clp protease ATP-binding subunit ClpC
MTFQELQHKADTFYPALLLEHYLPQSRRKLLLYLCAGLAALALLFVVLTSFMGTSLGVLALYTYKARGVLLLALAALVLLAMLDAMYYSYYFMNGAPMDFMVAQLIAKTSPDDVTKGFLTSPLGAHTMLRLGIGTKDVAHFLAHRTNRVTTREYQLVVQDADPYVTLAEYGRSLIHFDDELARFLKGRAIDAETFRASLTWVAQAAREVRVREAWWSRDALGRVPSIGRAWAYGQTYYLEQYGHRITEDQAYQHMSERRRMYEQDVAMVARILAKQHGANVMLLAEQSLAAMQVVAALAKDIADGVVRHELEGKQLFVINGTQLIDALKEKTDIEAKLRQLFAQAAQAGNVLLVIPEFASLIENASAVAVDIVSLFTEALSSDRISVIAVTNTRGFHESVETQHDLMRSFEKVVLPERDASAALSLVQAETHVLEATRRVLVTMQALQAVVVSADRYFADGAVTDKAVDLLHEVVAAVAGRGGGMVTAQDVYDIVASRTGIAQGDLSAAEQEKLASLEQLLHARIVGQDAAVSAVASALRRARAGLTNPKRPMGSFLFLGPTGVGKTETTKALAEVFFGDEDRIMRFDMSEFGGADGLAKLIGEAGHAAVGVLAAKLREQQYGVLLLDEIEKASREVHDIFLQVLDEGFFTDGRGERVHARNTIIIATSNAGSDMIYEATKQGADVVGQTDAIVAEIIKRGTFRPEFINRFDGVIVFHALDAQALAQVAKLLLVDLNERLALKQVTVRPTDALIAHLVAVGNNPTFGARAMRRALQDEVERVVADALIAGTIRAGDTVSLLPQDGKLRIV